MKFSNNELKVMNLIWDEYAKNPNKLIRAITISDKLTEVYGWKNTSNYAYLSRLVNKGAIKRSEPDYIITPLITRADVAISQNKSILQKFMDGSFVKLFNAYIQEEKITMHDLDEMKKIIESYDKDDNK